MRFRTRLVAALTVLGMSILAACGGGGGGGGGGVTPTNPPPATTPPPPPPLVCRSSGTPQLITQGAAPEFVARRMPNTIGGASNEYAPGIIEIVYRSPILAANRGEASRLIQRVGGDLRGELDAGAIGERVQIVAVNPGSEDDAVRQLSSSSIVQSVTRSAVRRLSSTTATFTNDPYFKGFAPANTPPLYMSAAIPGQWDMHVICAANAWGYGVANTTGSTFAGALGGTVKVAIVDTGADLTHPELVNRAIFAESVINGMRTVGIPSMHDNDGHGTDVAGIAAATGNNSFAFSGVAYASPLLIFKVFPDPPPGGCSAGSTSDLCTAIGADVGMAISDAVAQGAKVINLSLGASGPDTGEETAVANAIASGVVVVASSGNESIATLDFPARDPGVIAVGASSIDDSTPSAPVESVAGYSNYSAASSATWGLVAPGGDPSSDTDNDDLHWIENIFTSTAVPANPNYCSSPDFAGEANNCRVLIAGTSMSAPHVTGAVALLLSVNGTLTPATVKTLLCNSARNISNTKQGCGRLDVYRAMAATVGDPSP